MSKPSSVRDTKHIEILLAILGVLVAVLACVVTVTVPEIRGFLGLQSSSTPDATQTAPPPETLTPPPPGDETGTANIDMAELCIDDANPCQCVWSFRVVTPDFPEEMPDDKTIRNTGTGILEIFEVTNTCQSAGCISAKVNEERGPLVLPGGRNELMLSYRWKEDPLLGADHSHTITIRSSAANCPTLVIDVPIRYQ